MLQRLKEIIRTPRVIQLNNRYERELDLSYISYDAWIRQKELEFLAGTLPNTDDVQVVEYSEVGKNNYAGDIILFVNDRKKLAIRALYAVVSAFKENPKALVVYGDEDEYNSNRTIRMNPIFRPEWSPDTLRNYMYMGNVVAVKREAVRADISDIYELILAVTDGLDREQVVHVDYVLYHNDYSKTLYPEGHKEEYIYKGEVISILIPSRDNPDILKQLLDSVVNRTTGVTYEIIVFDNGSSNENKIRIEQIISDVKRKAKDSCKGLEYLYLPQDFNFSAICNRLAGEAKGDYLLFLNDDIEVRDGAWLSKMMRYAVKEHVGAVGAKLYYPESRVIQHCGITNLRLGPVHKLQYKEDNRVYYDHASDMDRDVIAVTGACLLIEREKFNDVGGFDESFAVAFNDVDLCFCLYEKGLYNVVVNSTHLWHYESLSRGDDESKDKIIRLTKERERLYEKHSSLYMVDPYYHDYLTRDILDSNYTYAYEYEYDGTKRPTLKTPRRIRYRIKDHWYNDCLIISLEQCGTLKYWLGPESVEEGADDTIYIGGYAFVAGSDNSCFEFKLLFKKKSEENGMNEADGTHGKDVIYEVPCNRIYRPDLEINLDRNERPALCGFSVIPDMSDMPKGEYQVGVMARGLASRLVLCRFTNRYIKNE